MYYELNGSVWVCALVPVPVSMFASSYRIAGYKQLEPLIIASEEVYVVHKVEFISKDTIDWEY